MAQVGLATLRRRELDPRLRLRPGDYGDQRIERVAVASAGPVPALYIVPAGGARGAVCVAHGSGCDTKTFYAWRLVDELVAAGVAALLVDLDGHGESERPHTRIIESVAAPARWLRARHGRVALLGMKAWAGR